MKYQLALVFVLVALSSAEARGPGRTNMRAHAESAMRAGSLYRIDPLVLLSVAWEESKLQVDLVSPRGACGVMQVMAQYVPDVRCADMLDLDIAYEAGAWVLSRWREHCLADDPLQCYNGGSEPGSRTRYYAHRVRKRVTWMVEVMRSVERMDIGG